MQKALVCLTHRKYPIDRESWGKSRAGIPEDPNLAVGNAFLGEDEPAESRLSCNSVTPTNSKAEN
jgi:hypothetical protein